MTDFAAADAGGTDRVDGGENESSDILGVTAAASATTAPAAASFRWLRRRPRTVRGVDSAIARRPLAVLPLALAVLPIAAPSSPSLSPDSESENAEKSAALPRLAPEL
jgi:hypothetical protein